MEYNRCWVCQMADVLTCEIIDVMSGIHLVRCPRSMMKSVEMDVVHGEVDGEYQMRLRFSAEPRMFERLARNMIGSEPESDEEIQEYATEFFNVLCGRFVSELSLISKTKARFYPTTFGKRSVGCCLDQEDQKYSLYFISEEQEQVQFSWSQGPMFEQREGAECYEA